jgi:hypothetical protein
VKTLQGLLDCCAVSLGGAACSVDDMRALLNPSFTPEVGLQGFLLTAVLCHQLTQHAH